MIRRADDTKILRIDGAVADGADHVERDGPVGPRLDASRPSPSADHGTVHSGDGLYTASIPLDELARAAIVDGRLQIPDAPTNCWNVKDVIRIELTAGKQPDSVPNYDDA